MNAEGIKGRSVRNNVHFRSDDVDCVNKPLVSLPLHLTVVQKVMHRRACQVPVISPLHLIFGNGACG